MPEGPLGGPRPGAKCKTKLSFFIWTEEYIRLPKKQDGEINRFALMDEVRIKLHEMGKDENNDLIILPEAISLKDETEIEEVIIGELPTNMMRIIVELKDDIQMTQATAYQEALIDILTNKREGGDLEEISTSIIVDN